MGVNRINSCRFEDTILSKLKKMLRRLIPQINIFAEILHAGRAAIDMKHIKWDFSLKAGVRVCWVGPWPKLNFFRIWP